MRVLIVEDSPLERDVLRTAVEAMGHECVVAADGEEGWERFLAGRPDVIISDWLMPRLQGLKLCQRVRAHPAGADPYFIFVTGLDDRGHAWQGIEAGGDDYLTKPLDLDELRLRLTVAARVTTLKRQLAALHREQGRLEGVRLTGLEVAHLLNNDLAPVVGAVDLVRQRLTLPPDLARLVANAAECLDRAVQHIAQLQKVVQVEVKETVAGPALDLERSTAPAGE